MDPGKPFTVALIIKIPDQIWYLIKFRYGYSSNVNRYITFYYCFAFLSFLSFCFVSFLVNRDKEDR